MAPPQTGSKKSSRRSRKARTEVSSSSEDSSSDSDSSISSPKPKTSDTKVQTKARESVSPSPSDDTPPPAQAPKTDNEQAFESFYLRQSAKEFSDDLDKLRSASDFKGQSSVELLVNSLKQGGACFSKDERSRVGSGDAGLTK